MNRKRITKGGSRSMVTSASILTASERTFLESLESSELKANFLKRLMEIRVKSSTPSLSYQERQRAGDLQRKNAANASLRDIGQIPDIANPKERERAKWDLRYHLERYHEEKWYLGWCNDHLRLVKLLQDSFLNESPDELIAVAMPRGSGKTSISRCAVEWGVLHGHLQWPILLEADADAYMKQMRAFAVTFRSKQLLAEDFPETIWVIQQMSTSQAAPNMTCFGENMHIIWKTNEIVLPTNYMSLELGTAAGIISGGGITGSVRGAQMTLASGEIVRPDAFVINDPQTRESAGSPKQIADRIDIVSADLLGMGGPGKPMRGVMTMTVIEKNDLADRILGPEFPQWRSIRGKWLEEWPTNMALWNEYAALLRRRKAEGGSLDDVNEFYEQYRRPYGPFCKTPGMDSGAKVYWEARINTPFISSLQSFMSWWILEPSAAMSEGQNQPIDPHEPEDVIYCSREEILGKLSSLERFEVPDDATELVAYIDVQQEVFVYAIMAICKGFRRYVVDYGTFPDQSREYWVRSQLASKLSDIWKSPKQAWLNGLIATTRLIDQLPFTRTNGQGVDLTFGLVDSSDGDVTDIVFEFCRQHGGGKWFPNNGAGALANDLNHRSEQKAWRKRHKDWGPHWNRTTDHDRGFDRIRHDADWYKSMVHLGIRTPEHDDGSLQFFEDDHQLLADHLRAEFPRADKKGAREYTHWQQRPQRPDNDLFDCISGCGLAGAVRKIEIPGMSGHGRNKSQRRRSKFGRHNLTKS